MMRVTIAKTLAALLIATPLSGCFFDSPEELFIVACDDTFKKRLKSPSSYQAISRTDVTYSPTTILWEMNLENYIELSQYRKFAEPNGEMYPLILEKYGKNDVERTRTLVASRLNLADRSVEDRDQIASFYTEYEAANSYGASLVGHYKCEVSTSKDGLSDKSAVYGVRLNGQTHLDWTFSNLSRD